ncbi:MAG: hypothetical protein P1U53_16730, partial [Sulfitobacter sp.]|nr:hypothetical protein [Sulfitobacter sp.]
MQMFQSSYRFASPLALALFLCWLSVPAWGQTTGEAQDWRSLAEAGETAFEEGSFQKAHELYTRSLAAVDDEEESPWLEFRKADAHLRSLHASQRTDRSEIDAAVSTLRGFFPTDLPTEKRTRIWALAGESIGDHFHQSRRTWGFGNALQPYTLAMDFWAGSSDLETARENWLRILWKMAWPAWSDGVGSYGGRNNWIPLVRLEQALQIAATDHDRARIHFMLARTAQNEGDGPWWDRRMHKAFDALKAMGPDTGYYDAGLWFEALWLENSGPWQHDDKGSARRQPKPGQALALYEILAKDKRWSQSAYRKNAKEHIRNILAKELNVQGNGAFLTGSKVGYTLRTRNLTSVECTLTQIELAEDVDLDARTEHANQWLQEIEVAGKSPYKRWTVPMEEESPHAQTYKTMAIDGDLPAGAYLLEVRNGSRKDRSLVLITETALVLRSSGQDLHAWVTDAITGKPMADQPVHARVRIRDRKGRGFWRQIQGTTG